MVRHVDFGDDLYSCGVSWTDDGRARYAEISCHEPLPQVGDEVRIRVLGWPFEGETMDYEGSYEALVTFTVGPAFVALVVALILGLHRARRRPIRLVALRGDVPLDVERTPGAPLTRPVEPQGRIQGTEPDPGTPVHLLLAEELLLLTDTRGRRVLARAPCHPILGAALCVELEDLGWLSPTGRGEAGRGRGTAAEPSPGNDGILGWAQLTTLALEGQEPSTTVGRLGELAEGRLLSRLRSFGLLRPTLTTAFGLFPATTWELVHPEQGEVLRQRLEDVLIGGRSPTPREAALLCLLDYAGMLFQVIPPGSDRHQLTRRLDEVVGARDRVTEGLREAVTAWKRQRRPLRRPAGNSKSGGSGSASGVYADVGFDGFDGDGGGDGADGGDGGEW